LSSPSPSTGAGGPSSERSPTLVLAFPDIDAYNAPRLRDVLAQCDPTGPTVVDFSAVTLCGAAAIHALLEAHARHERHGGSFHVSGARPTIRRLFDLTNTTGLLDNVSRFASADPGRSVPH
jgi:anti-anti-sigma factor